MQKQARLLFAATAFAALSSVASAASAQDSASASSTASVQVISPASVVKETDLVFGPVVRPTAGNTTVFTIDASSGATSTSGGDGAFFPGGSPGRATFTAFGSGGSSFTIAVDPTVVVDGITINLVKSAAIGTLGAGVTGTAGFGVGGNVTLGSTAPLGAHSGTFVVTITYP